MQTQIALLLDRSRADTLTGQLVDQMRDAIRLGRITPGVRLPSSRRLAEQLGIGRNTVVRAYDMLLTECYVEARPASGMYASLPRSLPGRAPARPESSPAQANPSGIVVTGKTRPALPGGVSPGAPAVHRARPAFDFAPNRPSAALFPLKTWRRMVQSCLSQGGAAGLSQPVDRFGLAALRAAIANHIAAARGIIADPGQIVITSGVGEALAVIARMFLVQGSRVAIENPCHAGAARAYAAAGATLLPVPVDPSGLVAADLPTGATALLHLTPAHQYPTGHTLAPARRDAAIAWARRGGCVIIEDDRGAEFRYEGATPHAVAAFASDCTIHLGTFSRALGGGVRLGYIVLPVPLVDAARAEKRLLGGASPWLEQAAVAELIRGGSFSAHVMRMRLAYRENRDHLLAALRRHFGEPEVSGEAGGLHLFWQLPPGVPDAATVEGLGRRARVGIHSLASANAFDAQSGAMSRRGIVLGYAALTKKQIDQGIARLSDAIDDALDGHDVAPDDLLAHRQAPAGARPAPVARRRAKPAPRIHHEPALRPGPAHRAGSRGRSGADPSKIMPIVTGLFRYPVKGLSPQPVARVALSAEKPFPFDRVFALARPGVAVDPSEPKWAKKGLFVMLMLDEGLARVRTHLDEATLRLTVFDGDAMVLSADLGEASEREKVEAFFHRLAPALRAAPRLVRARDGHFMDKPDNVISLINLATVRALEARFGFSIDPLRFRANIYIDGAAPWEEFDWVGGDIGIGDAAFRVDRRNGRCGATNVDPATGRRDLDIPGSLRRAFGHKDLGVYLVARNEAEIAVGDTLDVPRGVLSSRPPQPEAAPPSRQRAFICRGCYFVYQESRGLPADQIAPGTPFASLAAGWRCPDCGTEKSTFQPHMAEA